MTLARSHVTFGLSVELCGLCLAV